VDVQVLAPYDAEDARGLMKAAIRDPDPVIFLENEILYGESFPIKEEVLGKDFTVPIGKCKVGLSCCHKFLIRTLPYPLEKARWFFLLSRPRQGLHSAHWNNVR